MVPQLSAANAVFVTERIAVGGDLSPHFATARRQLDDLIAAGITHIVDLRSEWSDEVLVNTWAPQLTYLHHDVDDAGQVVPGEWFDALIDWVDEVLATDSTHKVLVHCHMGVNRAPSAVLAILIHRGYGLREALDLIRAARPVAVIDYAGDALTWYLRRSSADPKTRANLRRVLVRWRQSHDLDAIEVIRAIRSQTNPNSRWAVRLGPDDPETLGKVLAEAGEVAVGLTVDQDPPELGQLDEVLFLTSTGLTGRALVVGPAQQIETGDWMLPVMITELFKPVPVSWPQAVADWLAAPGPNPLLISRDDYLAMTSRPVVS
jgi:dual specificity phosphatase 3